MHQIVLGRLIGAIVLINICAVGYLYVSNSMTRNKNIALKTQLELTQRQLASERAEHQALKTAYQRLSETKLQIQTRDKTIIQRIQSAPESDDAPLAPVLKDTLEAIE